MWTLWCLFVMRSVISRRASGGWSATCVRASRFSSRITIADNGSTDATWAIADRLARELPEVRAVHMELPGRGRALRAIWSQSDAEVLAYMDVDLSTDLNALLPLVAPLLSGHSDLAIGTRLARGVAGHPRAQAGTHLARLQPAAADPDGGALLRRAVRLQGDQAGPGAGAAAAHLGYRLVLRYRAARAGRTRRAAHPRDPGGLDRRPRLARRHHRHRPGRPARHGPARGRLRARFHPGPAVARPGPGRRPGPQGLPLQIARFTVIGVASTVAYVVLFLLLRCIMPAQAANVVSLLLTAVANTAANRRLTFGISGRSNAARHQVKGLIAFGALPGPDLGCAGRAGPAHPGRLAEVSRASRRQPGRPPSSGSCCTGTGCSAARSAPGRLAARAAARSARSTETKWLPRESEPIERDHLYSAARGTRGEAAPAGPGACCAGRRPIPAGPARRCSGCWR